MLLGCHFFSFGPIFFRKLEFETIYNIYSNKSPFRYYISVFWGEGGLRPCLFCLFRGGAEFCKTCLYNTCMLPKNIQLYLQTFTFQTSLTNINYYILIKVMTRAMDVLITKFNLVWKFDKRN